MIDKVKNEEINRQLDKLYQSVTEEFLREYRSAFFDDPNPPSRIHKFGIVNPEQYDTDNGLLVICRETNGWDNQDFDDVPFLQFLGNLAEEGLPPSARPSATMWYNLGRWLTLIQNPESDLDQLAREKGSVLPALGTVAFTNINKVRGESSSRGKYWKLAYTMVSKQTLQKELEILCPRKVLLCGTEWPFVNLAPEFDMTKALTMYHPGARKGVVKMLEQLRAQL